MKAFLAAILFLVGLTSAQAHVRHHHYRHFAVLHHVHRSAARSIRSEVALTPRGAGLVTVQTAAGIPITVAANLAEKFEGLISDMVADGYRPHSIGCFARGGHVRNSNHYHGGACDFDQTARNRAPNFMYHVASLAAKWGLRDGCTFHDCGHIDDGMNVGWRRSRGMASYAYVRHRVRHSAEAHLDCGR